MNESFFHTLFSLYMVNMCHTVYTIFTYFFQLQFLCSCIVLKLPTFVKLLWQLLLFVVDAVVNDGFTKLNVNAIKCAVNVLVMFCPQYRLQYDFPKLKINLNKLVVLIKAIRTHINHRHFSHHIEFDFRWSISNEIFVLLKIIFERKNRIIKPINEGIIKINFKMETFVSNRKYSQSSNNFLWSHLYVTNIVKTTVK